ncbi:CPBP family intramembrane metalloprotease [Glycomyces sp. TRM65418]|uniref:CPBP family intramembrane glutamic endopeptidase n=1 Tax=Glycomyces sp. TRM65418 TaxID=2867006 RepID=UPI001CE6B315|nr:CPBP family intramembrane glutamic endopeptidase [Glycomyces sp. TRM65418]MCC3761948.1 CPBP family intramembrane metalloprotease [Glycomyces sp. TRM65418]QZD56027.1 CPBP family intramembrane metalloprotease [Glycomyces sp. TRM65418]
MERTPHLTTATEAARTDRIVERLLADRHSVPLSIALHLVPGALIVAAYYLIGQPITKAIDYPIFLAWAIALTVVLAPLQFGLLWLGRRRNGRYSLRGVLHYRDKPFSRGGITAIGIGLMVYMTVVALALVPLDNLVYEWAFTWVPFEGAGGSATAYLDAYSQSFLLVTLLVCLPFTGFSLPLVEEYYFRGFLLPRLPQLGGWAPLFNTVLFSVYHFWAPWTVLSKIVFLLPGVWFVWRKHDLRASIWMHPGSALLMTTAGLIAIALGLM